MQTKLISQQLEYLKKIRSYQVQFTVIDGEGDNLGTKDITLSFCKMIEDGYGQHDHDTEFTTESQEIFDNLGDDVQEMVMDYINDLDI